MNTVPLLQQVGNTFSKRRPRKQKVVHQNVPLNLVNPSESLRRPKVLDKPLAFLLAWRSSSQQLSSILVRLPCLCRWILVHKYLFRHDFGVSGLQSHLELGFCLDPGRSGHALLHREGRVLGNFQFCVEVDVFTFLTVLHIGFS